MKKNLIAGLTTVAFLELCTSATGLAQDASTHPERRGIGVTGFTDSDFSGRTQVNRSASIKKLPITIDARRSLFITEKDVLEKFSFKKVMETLANKSDPSLTKEKLFDEWWSSAAVENGSIAGCGSATLKPGEFASKFAFDYQCPRAEGSQSSVNAFDVDSPNSYIPIALINRFDLASDKKAGRLDCGEYRIIFAVKSGRPRQVNRNFIIFEAVLPNPTPGKIDGCLPVAKLWAELSQIPLAADRASKLHRLYFEGLPEQRIAAVITPAHYGDATKFAKGQIRTNQFLQFTNGPFSPWLLREFSFRSDGVRSAIIPATVKSNPSGVLFKSEQTHAKSKDFQIFFSSKSVATLKTGSINKFSFTVADKFNAGESDEMGDTMDYVRQGKGNTALQTAVEKSLSKSSKIRFVDILNRAEAMTCAGCHQLSNGAELGGTLGNWPSSLEFTHESESELEIDPTNPSKAATPASFKISPALKSVFLPHRKCVIEAFLNGDAKKRCD